MTSYWLSLMAANDAKRVAVLQRKMANQPQASGLGANTTATGGTE
jgi:hypothetical protein